jgi:hypothetical protein
VESFVSLVKCLRNCPLHKVKDLPKILFLVPLSYIVRETSVDCAFRQGDTATYRTR